jgi:hypothetical protein
LPAPLLAPVTNATFGLLIYPSLIYWVITYQRE